MSDTRKAILCVDDENLLLLALVRELENSFGDRFLYEKALNATQAYELIEELIREGVDLILIISDWLMPGTKGDEFLETVEKKYPGISAVMVTGHADEQVINHVLETGLVTDVIEKPWDPKRLIEAVEKCFIRTKGQT